jgi:Holliday junction resolvase RusA-like endonuclease
MSEQVGIAWQTQPVPPALLVFQVDGDAKAKGSMSSSLIKRGDGSLVTRANGMPATAVFENGGRHRGWARTVRAAAKAAIAGGWAVITRPVVLEVTFYFERPQKHHLGDDRSRQLRPNAPRYVTAHNRGDLSKLIRAVEDAITDAGVWSDDCLIVGYGNSSKLWAEKSYAVFRVLEAP